MNTYKERLESSGLSTVFAVARKAGDDEGMARVLREAQFSEMEIQAILWAKGDLAPVGQTEAKATFGNALSSRLAIALVSGLLLGGTFVYFSSGLNEKPRSGETKMDAAMRDYRSPSETYYRPFMWGFAIGAIGGFITGALVYDPISKDA